MRKHAELVTLVARSNAFSFCRSIHVGRRIPDLRLPVRSHVRSVSPLFQQTNDADCRLMRQSCHRIGMAIFTALHRWLAGWLAWLAHRLCLFPPLRCARLRVVSAICQWRTLLEERKGVGNSSTLSLSLSLSLSPTDTAHQPSERW